jgi:hypothetical protein
MTKTKERTVEEELREVEPRPPLGTLAKRLEKWPPGRCGHP